MQELALDAEEEEEDQELLDLVSTSGDNSGNNNSDEESILDNPHYGRESSNYGFQTPNKRNRSNLSDSSTEEFQPTPKMSTPRRINIGPSDPPILDSPTIYDKVTKQSLISFV